MGNRSKDRFRNQEVIFSGSLSMAESSGNVLGYKFTGTIIVDDIEKIEPEVNALVQKEGNVRILFNLTGFNWEQIKTLVADLKFGHKFHEKIQRMAIVGDKT